MPVRGKAKKTAKTHFFKKFSIKALPPFQSLTFSVFWRISSIANYFQKTMCAQWKCVSDPNYLIPLAPGTLIAHTTEHTFLVYLITEHTMYTLSTPCFHWAHRPNPNPTLTLTKVHMTVPTYAKWKLLLFFFFFF